MNDPADKIGLSGWIVIGMFAFALGYACIQPLRPEPPTERCDPDSTEPTTIDARDYQRWLEHIEQHDTIGICEFLEQKHDG